MGLKAIITNPQKRTLVMPLAVSRVERKKKLKIDEGFLLVNKHGAKPKSNFILLRLLKFLDFN